MIRWPSADDLARMGFVGCKRDGCSTHINPLFSRSGLCRTHWAEDRRENPPDRFRNEARFAPRPRAAA